MREGGFPQALFIFYFYYFYCKSIPLCPTQGKAVHGCLHLPLPQATMHHGSKMTGDGHGPRGKVHLCPVVAAAVDFKSRCTFSRVGLDTLADDAFRARSTIIVQPSGPGHGKTGLGGRSMRPKRLIQRAEIRQLQDGLRTDEKASGIRTTASKQGVEMARGEVSEAVSCLSGSRAAGTKLELIQGWRQQGHATKARLTPGVTGPRNAEIPDLGPKCGYYGWSSPPPVPSQSHPSPIPAKQGRSHARTPFRHANYQQRGPSTRHSFC